MDQAGNSGRVHATFTTDSLQTFNEDESLPASQFASYLVDVVVKCIICFITLLGNLLTIIAFIKFPSLRRIANWFLVSMAVSDLFSGVIMITQLLEVAKCSVIQQYILLAFSHVFVLVSMVHILLVASDRYLAISHPLHYDRKMTSKRAGFMIGGTWLIVAVISIAPVLEYTMNDSGECMYVGNTPYYITLELVIYVVTMVTITIVYTNILLVVRRQQKKVSHDPQPSEIGSISPLGQSAEHTQSTQTSRSCPENGQHNEMKSASTSMKINRPVLILLVLILALFVLWTPYMLAVLLVVLGAFNPVGYTMRTLLTLGFINSAVNTFVYAIISREYRDAYKKIITCQP